MQNCDKKLKYSIQKLWKYFAFKKLLFSHCMKVY